MTFRKTITALLLITSILFLDACDDTGKVAVKKNKYALRDRGPANGWIFYINPDAETDGWKYLECAPGDADGASYHMWGGGQHAIGGTGSQIGTGSANTALIVNFFDGLVPDYYTNDFSVNTTFTNPSCTLESWNTGEVAAKMCADYSVEFDGTTYSDWFLPSSDELSKMYVNLARGTDENGVSYTPIGGFHDIYWSSTETGSNWVMMIFFTSEGSLEGSKGNVTRSRPVRAF